jgi:tRNA G10  N-methylase Trm11
MRTFMRMSNRHARRLPEQFRGEELRYPEELAAAFVRQHTRPGDLVLDPFAGYGTTLLAAEAMGRRALGLELDERRVAYVRTLLRDPGAIRQADTRRAAELALPPCDFLMTSPPFAERGDELDPLANYGAPGAGYDAYLEDMRRIFAQLRHALRPGARAVLEVSNLKGPAGVTTLAWDIARAAGASLRFEGEVIVAWDHYAYGYDHSYCLVFRND